MDIENLKKNKPHLTETLDLYEKIVEFKTNVSGMIISPAGINSTAYAGEMIPQVFDAFSAATHMPEDMLGQVKEAMMLGQIDFTRLPLNETPAFSLPLHEDDLIAILFLLSKPFFIRSKTFSNADNINTFWEEGRCPVCHGTPSIAFFDKDGKRQLYCSFCETTGPYKRLGCPVCMNNDSAGINIIRLEGENGFRADTCDSCRSYIKTFDASVTDDIPCDLADIISIPLDIVVQGRGFSRRSPNPVGLMRMA